MATNEAWMAKGETNNEWKATRKHHDSLWNRLLNPDFLSWGLGLGCRILRGSSHEDPANSWKMEFPFGDMAYFQVRTVSFREGAFLVIREKQVMDALVENHCLRNVDVTYQTNTYFWVGQASVFP